ncbi:amidohydrolase family protein [Runella slithyformis]|uniref:Amidohydrolase n=1 Tax=Runella slithyformis (strain ATCC 29530 / DSM 19594 / LMG 11500 / NCIMB 11436 / LSU 4) TaxID=761193 RepID=A0A7U4E7W0_RUNSL|nr:amidohydrolase family protein [Runella slithyformis]AEI50799.1 amidohydrolase [Runella slithyformis DSM 19594]
MKNFLFFLILAPCTLFAQRPVDNRKREIVFKAVNVIPMDRERVIENQTVVVKNGRITALGSEGKVRFSKEALVIDAGGKYLTPGWAEIHAHVPPIDDLEPMKEVLMLYLANGITTIRGMLGHPKHLELRSRINDGSILGPHFYTTGPSFNGQTVKTAERGVEMVREQKAAGYDFLKLHPGLTKETFSAIAKTARQVGIPYVGHVSFNVGVWMAMEAKYSTIDHMDGFIEALTPGIDTLVEQETGLFGSWIAQRADVSLIPKLMTGLRTNSIRVVPTQALAERWLSPLPAEEYTNDPEMKYIKPEQLTAWVNAKNSYTANPNFSKAGAQKLIEIRRKLIYECRKNGVELLLGSDAPQIFNVPGFSIHREMKYLVDAGLTPYEALRTGTVNVASYLNQSDAGTVRVGNVSDLVLLTGNPLKDIGQTKNIEGVMIGTNWLSKEYFEKELKKIEKL